MYEERRGAFPDRPQPRDLVRAVGSRSDWHGRRLQARGGKLPEMLLRLPAPAREQIGQRESEISAGGSRNIVSDLADRCLSCPGQRRICLDRRLHRLEETLSETCDVPLMLLECEVACLPRRRGQPLAQLGDAELGT